MMLAADINSPGMSTAEEWMLGIGIVTGVCAVGAFIVAIVALYKRQEMSISPQPLAVQLVEELHEQFAGKAEFKELVKNNTERHGQIFSRIDRVEREARELTEKRITEINADRSRTMDKLNEQFSFIRESIAEIKTELKIRHEGES